MIAGSFTTSADPDGTDAVGNAATVPGFFDFRLEDSGPVSCLRVEGNRATIGFVSDPGRYGIPEAPVFVLAYVEDNGPSGDRFGRSILTSPTSCPAATDADFPDFMVGADPVPPVLTSGDFSSTMRPADPHEVLGSFGSPRTRRAAVSGVSGVSSPSQFGQVVRRRLDAPGGGEQRGGLGLGVTRHAPRHRPGAVRRSPIAIAGLDDALRGSSTTTPRRPAPYGENELQNRSDNSRPNAPTPIRTQPTTRGRFLARSRSLRRRERADSDEKDART